MRQELTDQDNVGSAPAHQCEGIPATGDRNTAEVAPAKVNLFLHVRDQRADGYHLLESLAVFPGLGDRIWAEASSRLSLSMTGTFGDNLPGNDDNLVLKAADMLARRHGITHGAALRLEKNLPVASGIGGGSSDAAAALRVLARLWDVAIPDDLALALGADVPVCLSPRPQMMEGIGEVLTPVPALPAAWIVLVNPMQGVSTGAVFSGLAHKSNPGGPAMPPLVDFATMIDWLSAMRNDLQIPAIAACPAIGRVLAALAPAPLARMSGSGATCFALFGTEVEATACAETLRRDQPGWWVASAPMSVEQG